MLPSVRKQKIKEMICESLSVSVNELATLFQVSGETIRRDLKELESEGILYRNYGGAYVKSDTAVFIEASTRVNIYSESKQTIAQRAKAYIHPDDIVFLDHSTTAYFIAKTFQDMPLTVITNSLKIANHLAGDANIRLVVAGGQYDNSELGFYGRTVIATIEQYAVQTAFISCGAISLGKGYYDTNEAMAGVRQSVLKHAQKRILIADYSKFEKVALSKIADIETVDGIITDRTLSPEWHAFCTENHIFLEDGGKPNVK